MSNTEKNNNIVIIGAGMVGVATALQLIKSHSNVMLIDPLQTEQAASYGNAGALNPSSVAPVTIPGLVRRAPGMLFDTQSPLFLRWGYLPRLLPWLVRYLSHATAAKAGYIASHLAPLLDQCLNEHQALAENTPAARFINPGTCTVLYKNRAAFAADKFIWELRKKAGLEWEIIEGSKYRDLEPELAEHADFAVRLPEHGFLSDPGCYLETLREHFRAVGGKLIQGTVENIICENDRAAALTFNGQQIACDKLVITAGAWSGKLTAKLGIKIPLESERGYHIEFIEPSFMPRLGTTLIACGHVFMTPMDGRLRCTSITEFAGLDAPPNQAALDCLKNNVVSALPKLRWQEIRTWMGHRPATTDSLPVIGKVPQMKNVFMGFGHHHVGMMSGPRTGRLLAEVIAGGKPDIDLSPYSPARFQ